MWTGFRLVFSISRARVTRLPPKTCSGVRVYLLMMTRGVLPVAPISALERPRVCSAVNFCPDRSLYSRVRVRGYTVVSARFRPRARLRVRLSPPARGSRYLTEGEFRGRILFPPSRVSLIVWAALSPRLTRVKERRNSRPGVDWLV